MNRNEQLYLIGRLCIFATGATLLCDGLRNLGDA